VDSLDDAVDSLDDAADSLDGAVDEAAPSVPLVVDVELGTASPLDFFSASIPFFRPSDG
jgi:hypothetical protein